MSINKRQAHGKSLCHTNHGIVNCAITMWMQLTHNFTDNTCALYMAAFWTQPHI